MDESIKYGSFALTFIVARIVIINFVEDRRRIRFRESFSKVVSGGKTIITGLGFTITYHGKGADNETKLPAKSMKSKSPNVIPVSRELRALLLRRRLKTKGSPYVFPSPKTPSCHLENPHKVWYKAIEKAKIKNLRFHDLRRKFASRLGDLGYPIQAVKQLLNQRDIRVTERYILTEKKTLREAMEKVTQEKVT